METTEIRDRAWARKHFRHNKPYRFEGTAKNNKGDDIDLNGFTPYYINIFFAETMRIVPRGNETDEAQLTVMYKNIKTWE